MNTNIVSHDTIGTAVRYKNPKHGFFGNSGRKVYLDPKPLAYLNDLIGYDQMQVAKEIEALASIPSPNDGWVQKFKPNFFKAKSGLIQKMRGRAYTALNGLGILNHLMQVRI